MSNVGWRRGFSPLLSPVLLTELLLTKQGGEREREKGVVEKILDKGGITGQPKTFWGTHLSLSPSPLPQGHPHTHDTGGTTGRGVQ